MGSVRDVCHLVQLVATRNVTDRSDVIHQQFAGLYNIDNIHCTSSPDICLMSSIFISAFLSLQAKLFVTFIIFTWSGHLLQGAYRSWKVMEFKIQIFQAWKVMELGLGPGKSWKVWKINYAAYCQITTLFDNNWHCCKLGVPIPIFPLPIGGSGPYLTLSLGTTHCTCQMASHSIQQL